MTLSSVLSSVFWLCTVARIATGQAPVEFRFEIYAFSENGESVGDVRIGLVRKPSDARPMVKCISNVCDGVSPGSYTLLVFAEGMLTIRRDVELAAHDRVMFVEMIPLRIQEPGYLGVRSISVDLVTNEVNRDRGSLFLRLVGIVNGVTRNLSIRGTHAEFRNVPTGRYLLLLLRSGQCIGARVIWYNEATAIRENIEEAKDGCALRIP